MQTTGEFLAEIKAKYGLKSNYALAKLMGQTDTAVARWMHGKNSFSDETAIHVADLLDLDPAYVVACIHAEREKNDAVRLVWSRMAERMAIAAALVAVALIAPALPWDNSPLAPLLLAGTVSGTRSLYIMSNAAALLAALSFTFAYACPRYIRRPKN